MNQQQVSFSLFTRLQFLLPHHLIVWFVFRLTHWRLGWLTRRLIKRYIRVVGVDMSEAEQPDPEAYDTINAFFTRALKTSARPVTQNKSELACPVDGAFSQFGNIENDTLIQAKGHDYSLKSLLAGRDDLTNTFRNGSFATIYLSPRDYHRIHMPLCGDLQEMIYVPGRLFSVNDETVNYVPALFARNERVITLFETDAGLMALILVGAINVGSMETIWHGMVTPPYKRSIETWNYHHSPIHLTRGDEMGRFNMGSTVILLFAEGRNQWLESLQVGQTCKMGQSIARIIEPV
jgi:phosphatidylserine decarboxylase